MILFTTITHVPGPSPSTDVIVYMNEGPANHLPVALAVLACMVWRVVRWLRRKEIET